MDAPTGAWLTQQLRRAEAHADRIAPLLEAAVAEVLADVGNVAAAAFTAQATSLTAAAPGVRSTSTMIALKPTPEQAAALALQDGEAPDTLHVTLCYLGDTEGPLTALVDALRPVALNHASLAGVVGGIGSFLDMGDGYPILALPDVPGLVELRVAVTEALAAAGVDYARNHGYCPHITLAYRPAPAFVAEALGVPLTFGELLIVRGDVEVIPLPLAGVPPLTAALEPVPGAPGNLAARTPIQPPRDAENASEDVDWSQVRPLIRAVAEEHRPSGGYGDTWYRWNDHTVFWECGDWTTNDEVDAAEAAFLAIPGVDRFEVGSEEQPTAWELVYNRSRADNHALAAAPLFQWLTADASPPFIPPGADEIVDVDALMERINARIRPVRDAAVEAAGRPVVESVGLSWDVTNPFVGQVLSQTGSQVTEIAHTTQLNVMRIVRASYRDGLSIPHTAEAIRVGMADASPARARLIARTELAGAVNGGSLAAVRIVEGALGVAYRKVWMTAPGAKHPRHYRYDGLNGQTRALAGKFDVGGSELDHPGDSEGPPREICNCFPAGTLVAAHHDARVGYRRRYDGSLVTVETAVGHRLSGTPNHPVLTDAGWKPLGELREGDHLICASLREDVAVAAPHVDHAPAPIEQVVGALARHGVTRRVSGRAVQFHGDPSADGQVDVVTPDRQLRHRLEPTLQEHRGELALVGAGLREPLLPGERSRLSLPVADALLASSGVRRRRESLALRDRRLPHPDAHRGATAPRLDARLEQVPADDATADPVELGERLFGDAFEVARAQIVAVKVDAFHGEVFNLETGSGAYIAGGIIAHNCRCAMRYEEGEAPAASRARAPGGGGVPGSPRAPGGGGVPGSPGVPDVGTSTPDTISVGEGDPVPEDMRARIVKFGLDLWPPKLGRASRRILGKAVDTQELYSHDGVWDADRQPLHDRIVASHFAGKTAAGPKVAYMTAGGSASGKSAAVFTSGGREVPMAELAARRNVIHVDPDAIKEMIPEYQVLRDAKDLYAASAVHEESSVIAARVVAEAKRRGFSVILDSTGSSGSFAGKISGMTDAGYTVQVTMFSIPTNEAIVRSVARGDRSGRYVAIAPLKYAHYGSAKQMLQWKDSKLVDEWRVYDNTTGARLVAYGGHGRATIVDQKAFDAIAAKANEGA